MPSTTAATAATALTAAAASNQPLVDFLLERASARANPHASAAYRRAAETIAAVSEDLMGRQSYKARNALYDTFTRKMWVVIDNFIQFYPMKSEYERTNSIYGLLPPKTLNACHLKATIMILKEPHYPNFASPVYKGIYNYYHRSGLFDAYSRAYIAAELEKRC